MRIIVLFAALALPGLASPIPMGDCGSGTMDEYIALGSTGCVSHHITWLDFSFSATLNGTPLDPAEMAINFDYHGPVYLLGNAPWVLSDGDELVVDWGFAVSAPQLFFIQAVTPLSFINTSRELCVDGVFDPSCTGVLVDPGDLLSVMVVPVVDVLALRIHEEALIRFNASNFRLNAVAETAPEASSFSLLAAGLSLLLIRKLARPSKPDAR